MPEVMGVRQRRDDAPRARDATGERPPERLELAHDDVAVAADTLERPVREDQRFLTGDGPVPVVEVRILDGGYRGLLRGRAIVVCIAYEHLSSVAAQSRCGSGFAPQPLGINEAIETSVTTSNGNVANTAACVVLRLMCDSRAGCRGRA
jgi:hypothetical protein